MTIRFTCDACGAEHHVGDQHAGKQAICKKCGVKLEIPAVSESAAAAEPLFRILVVEDDRDLAKLLQLTLEPAYECLFATNGLDGWQTAIVAEPDLIISDIMMPVMDGYEFIKRLRAEPMFKSLPVVLLSALGTKDQVQRGYELGATLYITKPVDPLLVKEKVQQLQESMGITPKVKQRTIEEVEEALTLPAIAPVRAEDGSAAVPEAASRPAAKPAARGPRRKVPPAPRAKVRILVVEDDRAAATAIKSCLDDEHEAVIAYNGLEAIEYAVKFIPDIFVIDGMLPKMSGYQLVPVLKRNRIFAEAPVIFLSEKTRARDKKHVEKLGVKHFLVKPFNLEQLLTIVKTITDNPAFRIHRRRVDHVHVVAAAALVASESRWDPHKRSRVGTRGSTVKAEKPKSMKSAADRWIG